MMRHWNQIWRLFLLQNSRNEKTLDGLGFLHVLAPRFPDPSTGERETEDFARRHGGYFNANPVLASYIAGVVTNLEMRRRSGEDVTPERVERVKNALAAVLTARGDYFFDVVLMPLGLTIGSIFAIHSSYFGPVLFLALYNLYHLRTRIGGYLIGVRLGEGLGRELVSHLFREQRLLGGCAAFSSGVLAAIVFSRAYTIGGPRSAGWGVVVALAMALLLRRVSFLLAATILFLATAAYLLF